MTLIFRPDIEDRSFHETVKAFMGPETDWPQRVTPHGSGCDFSLCSGHTLSMTMARGVFVQESQWQYMV
ncbi:MAG: hypothetical protein ABR513_10215, partial [Desulfotignum sp.]